MVMTRVTINGVRVLVRGSIGYVMLWVRAALPSAPTDSARDIQGDRL